MARTAYHFMACGHRRGVRVWVEFKDVLGVGVVSVTYVYECQRCGATE